MAELLATLARALQAVGGLHPLAIGLPAALGVLRALYVAADDGVARPARRAAGVAAGLLGLALLVRLGLALGDPRPLVPWWQAALGLVVLPAFLKAGRLGGVAAMLWFLCLAIVLATGAAWVGDPRQAVGAAFCLGAAVLGGALVARRLLRPPPVPPAPLQQRLDSDEAREGADKYTRE